MIQVITGPANHHNYRRFVTYASIRSIERILFVIVIISETKRYFLKVNDEEQGDPSSSV